MTKQISLFSFGTSKAARKPARKKAKSSSRKTRRSSRIKSATKPQRRTSSKKRQAKSHKTRRSRRATAKTGRPAIKRRARRVKKSVAKPAKKVVKATKRTSDKSKSQGAKSKAGRAKKDGPAKDESVRPIDAIYQKLFDYQRTSLWASGLADKLHIFPSRIVKDILIDCSMKDTINSQYYLKLYRTIKSNAYYHVRTIHSFMSGLPQLKVYQLSGWAMAKIYRDKTERVRAEKEKVGQ